jgi:Arc/MetJ-type ribon-helix-helix transcriptional regulator
VTIELTPEQVQIVQYQLDSGHFKSVDEVLAAALASFPSRPRSNRDAVSRMLEFSKKYSVQLPPGETVERLVHFGHRS